MILSDSLSRQKHNNSNPHEIILILFNLNIFIYIVLLSPHGINCAVHKRPIISKDR